jgi:hypothetical protein
MNTKKLLAKIAEAWQQRENGQLDEFTLSLLDLHTAAGLPLGLHSLSRSELVNLEVNMEENLLAEILLLNLSFQRSRHEIARAIEIHAAITERLQNHHYTPSFKFYSEKALNHYYQSEFLEALECYRVARATAIKEKNISREASAELNALLCLESLEMPRTTSENTLKKLSAQLNRDENAGFFSQLQSYEIRKLHGQGNLSAIFSESEIEAGQAVYLRLYLALLPYSTFHRRLDALESRRDFGRLMSHEYAFQRSFRVRTLKLNLQPEELHTVSGTFLIDRIYLWTWSWLISNEASLLEKILKCFTAIQDWSFSPQSSSDRLRLQNALRWIALVEPKSKVFTEAALKKIAKPQGQLHHLYHYESTILNALEDPHFREEANHHPLALQKDILFRNLLNPTAGNHALQPLQARIQKKPDTLAAATEIKIDLESFSLRSHRFEEIISEPLALAFSLFTAHDSVSFEEFARTCFGIFRYDQILHQPKIYNLLQRMKSILGGNDLIMTKGGKIYRRGSWPSITLRGQVSMTPLNLWKNILSTAESSASPAFTRQLDLLLKTEVIKAQHFISALNRPRSSTLKMMKDWVNQGVISAQGKGKNTIYTVNQPEKLKLLIERDAS